MSAADVRDVLDLPATAEERLPRPRPAKKAKPGGPKPDGIRRELYALLGDEPPPLPMTEGPAYKSRPRWGGKVRPWEWKEFKNSARSDGLVLRHWARKEAGDAAANSGTENGADTDRMEVDGEEEQKVKVEEYPFAKFNIKAPVPTYTDEEYEASMTSTDWSKAETDYLYELCRDFDLRFVVIHDRYEFPGDGPDAPPKPRTMEDLKARYYHSYRALLAHRTPVDNMTSTERAFYESLNFDADRETTRKKLAQILEERSPEEKQEEEYLIAELKRIMAHKERMLEERNEIFARLEAPNHVGSIAAYQGSAGLAALSQQMLNTDKSKKRKSIAITGTATAGSAAGSGSVAATPISETAPTPTSARDPKKSAAEKPSSKALTPEEEARLGISHHEKLTQGVSLRSTRLAPIKGSHQQKLYALMSELGIPQTLVMPTVRTTKKMEALQQACISLVDVRKVLEKAEQERRVERARVESLEKELGVAAKEEEKEGGVEGGEEKKEKEEEGKKE